MLVRQRYIVAQTPVVHLCHGSTGRAGPRVSWHREGCTLAANADSVGYPSCAVHPRRGLCRRPAAVGRPAIGGVPHLGHSDGRMRCDDVGRYTGHRWTADGEPRRPHNGAARIDHLRIKITMRAYQLGKSASEVHSVEQRRGDHYSGGLRRGDWLGRRGEAHVTRKTRSDRSVSLNFRRDRGA